MLIIILLLTDMLLRRMPRRYSTYGTIEALVPFAVDDASGGHAFPHPLILIPDNISALPGVVVFQRTVLLVWFEVTGFGIHYGWI